MIVVLDSRQAPAAVVDALLRAYAEAARQTELTSKLPLHIALEDNAAADVRRGPVAD